MITSDIKTMFYKNWLQKDGKLIEILLCITQMSAIKQYPMIYPNFDSLESYFQIFIILKLRSCVLDLGLYFLDFIVEITGKVVERKISPTKL